MTSEQEEYSCDEDVDTESGPSILSPEYAHYDLGLPNQFQAYYQESNVREENVGTDGFEGWGSDNEDGLPQSSYRHDDDKIDQTGHDDTQSANQYPEEQFSGPTFPLPSSRYSDILPSANKTKSKSNRSVKSLHSGFKARSTEDPSLTSQDVRSEHSPLQEEIASTHSDPVRAKGSEYLGSGSSVRSDTGRRAANSIISSVLNNIMSFEAQKNEASNGTEVGRKTRVDSASSVASSLCPPQQSPRTSSRISKWIDNLSSISDVTKVIEEKAEFTFPTLDRSDCHRQFSQSQKSESQTLNKEGQGLGPKRSARSKASAAKSESAVSNGKEDDISDADSVSQVGEKSEVTTLVGWGDQVRRRPGFQTNHMNSWYGWPGAATFAGDTNPRLPVMTRYSLMPHISTSGAVATIDFKDVPEGKHYFKLTETTTQKRKFELDGSQTVNIFRTVEQEENICKEDLGKRSQMARLIVLVTVGGLLVAFFLYLMISLFYRGWGGCSDSLVELDSLVVGRNKIKNIDV